MTRKMLIIILLETLGIVFLWVGLAISVLIHEMGHMVGYKLAKGQEDWVIQVGFGKKLFQTKHFDIRIFPFSGVFYHPTLKSACTKAQALLCTAGGPVFNLVLILVLFALSSRPSAFIDYYEPSWNFVRTYNVIMFISAILPVRYPAFFPIIGGMESDGKHLLKALRK